MNLRTFFIISFFISGITLGICGYFLIYVHKTRYPNLWNREKKKDSIWIPYERTFAEGLFWTTPYWIKREKDALVVLWIYRTCLLLGSASFIGFIYFSLERVN